MWASCGYSRGIRLPDSRICGSVYLAKHRLDFCDDRQGYRFRRMGADIHADGGVQPFHSLEMGRFHVDTLGQLGRSLTRAEESHVPERPGKQCVKEDSVLLKAVAHNHNRVISAEIADECEFSRWRAFHIGSFREPLLCREVSATVCNDYVPAKQPGESYNGPGIVPGAEDDQARARR